MGTADVEAVWRIESARIVAALTRFTGDFGLAEDAAQEAVAEALVSWPRASPANPAGWLMATARRRAIDAIRRRVALQERYALLAADPALVQEIDPDRIDDDVLALMFVSCHPVLSREARVALTLRVVGGLSTEEIARAFLVPVPTVQARITRGKKAIAAARVPFELPPAGERRERLGGVLSVLYVIFTEGSTATSGDRLLRTDVAYEAIRLARTLAALQPNEPEVHGLLGSGAGPGHRGRVGRLEPAPRVAPRPDRTRRAADPPRPACGGAHRAGTRRPALRQSARTLGAARQGGALSNLGWVARYTSSDPDVAVQLVFGDATVPEDSVISPRVDDVDGAYAEAQRLGQEIVHPLTTEPYGMRRFFVRDPDGNVVNVAAHRS